MDNDESISALVLLSRMRFACGDNGLRMQDELEEYLRGLKRDSDELEALKAEIAGAAVGVLRDARGFDGDSISDDDLSAELVGQRVALLRLPAGEPGEAA